jgi:hypothetical protein
MKILALILATFVLCGPANAYQCNDRHYRNSDGETVHSPSCDGQEKRHTAVCRDGSESYSRHRRGTCSHHGGVAKWE